MATGAAPFSTSTSNTSRAPTSSIIRGRPTCSPPSCKRRRASDWSTIFARGSLTSSAFKIQPGNKARRGLIWAAGASALRQKISHALLSSIYSGACGTASASYPKRGWPTLLRVRVLTAPIHTATGSRATAINFGAVDTIAIAATAPLDSTASSCRTKMPC